MAWTTPGTAVAGAVLTSSFWNEQVRDNFVEQFPLGVTPTDWVPTFSGGWALGNSTYTAKYWRVGKLVTFFAAITIGSTATKGTGMNIALPTAAVFADSVLTATVLFEDVGSAFVYGFARPASTTTLNIDAINTSTSYAQAAQITATTPFTWATGDRIWINATYISA